MRRIGGVAKLALEKLLRSKRALSPIFATLLLVAIVITFGTVAYYYASNVTTNATNEYASYVTDTRQSISERVGFEKAAFIASDSSNPPSSGPTLTVYILNCGSASNLQVSAVLLNEYDTNHNLDKTTPYNIEANTHSSAPSDSSFIKLNDSALKPLNVGQEGYFAVKLSTGTTLTSGYYSIQLITKSGSSFNYAP